MLLLIHVSLELQTGRLQFPQRSDRRRGKLIVAIDDRIIRGHWEAQRSQSSLIMNAEKKVPFGQRSGSALLEPSALILAPLHQYPSPAIRRRIEKNTEVGSIWSWILMAGRECEIRVKGKNLWAH